MFIATALSLRGENNILSSSPQEAAHLIAKLQAGICRRDRHNGIEGEHAASRFVSPPGADDIARRFAIFVRRPGQQGRASFRRADRTRMLIVQQSHLLELFSDQTRGPSTQQQTKTHREQGPSLVSGGAPEGESERSDSIAAPQRKTKTTDSKKIGSEMFNQWFDLTLVRSSCLNPRWAIILCGTLLANDASAAPGDNMAVVRDLASAVGPIIGSALACPNIARPRVQVIVDKFQAAIREAINEPDRADVARLLDRYVADGRSAVTTGKTDCGIADRQISD